MSKKFTRRDALTAIALASIAPNIAFAQPTKKRIVILIDGTLNDESLRPQSSEPAHAPGCSQKKEADYNPGGTNVALLFKEQYAAGPLIPRLTSNGISQEVGYFPGPKNGPLGLDLRKPVTDAYDYLVSLYEDGDEIYLFGFSRGAYGARALANMINTVGIRKKQSPIPSSTMWDSYQSEEKRGSLPISLVNHDHIHESRDIACVGLWDTVSSFGAPGGYGVDFISNLVTDRYFEGFHGTSLPANVKVALHAVAVDETRRSFIPMFLAAPGGVKPASAQFVEQAWFPGVHCNVGGGYPDRGLSDIALIWMIARVQEWTQLEFDNNNVRMETGCETGANIDGEVYDSSPWIPYIVSNTYNFFESFFHPAGRRILYKESGDNKINETVHWSVKLKYDRPCRIGGADKVAYRPPYFDPRTVPANKILRPSEKELALLPPRVKVLLPTL